MKILSPEGEVLIRMSSFENDNGIQIWKPSEDTTQTILDKGFMQTVRLKPATLESDLTKKLDDLIFGGVVRLKNMLYELSTSGRWVRDYMGDSGHMTKILEKLKGTCDFNPHAKEVIGDYLKKAPALETRSLHTKCRLNTPEIRGKIESFLAQKLKEKRNQNQGTIEGFGSGCNEDFQKYFTKSKLIGPISEKVVRLCQVSFIAAKPPKNWRAQVIVGAGKEFHQMNYLIVNEKVLDWNECNSEELRLESAGNTGSPNGSTTGPTSGNGL